MVVSNSESTFLDLLATRNARRYPEIFSLSGHFGNTKPSTLKAEMFLDVEDDKDVNDWSLDLTAAAVPAPAAGAALDRIEGTPHPFPPLDVWRTGATYAAANPWPLPPTLPQKQQLMIMHKYMSTKPRKTSLVGIRFWQHRWWWWRWILLKFLNGVMVVILILALQNSSVHTAD